MEDKFEVLPMKEAIPADVDERAALRWVRWQWWRGGKSEIRLDESPSRSVRESVVADRLGAARWILLSEIV